MVKVAQIFSHLANYLLLSILIKPLFIPPWTRLSANGSTRSKRRIEMELRGSIQTRLH